MAAIFITSLLIFIALAYVITTPRPSQEFFQLYVLGFDHDLARYYPNNDPNVSPNSTVQWYVGVTNSMSSVQYVVLKLKLGNSTTPAPNETASASSPAPLLAQYSRVLLQNETWEFPFYWSIVGENRRGNAISLEMNVNGTDISMTDPMTQGGNNYRIFIELWVYNSTSNDIEFGWGAGSQRKAAWLQVWFNATLPGQ